MSKQRAAAVGLSIGAIGVVFGDIGTSPLYAMRTIFGYSKHSLDINQTNVYGILSLIIWSLMIVVTFKYLLFIMRAGNRGEGGIMALLSRIKGTSLGKAQSWLFITIGLAGVALFFGDGVMTPAISVLSAVEGLKVVAPPLVRFIIPATIVILAYLFWIQRYGTQWIGRLFGPVMLVWFASIAAAGLWRVLQFPGVLNSLSPLAAINFITAHPGLAFLSMGLVILAITGAEALYADMGHFGRPAIARGWAFVVFPALCLCYMGQGALLLNTPETSENPFMLLFPHATRVPVLMLATFATLIASQAVISGAFSLARQAIHLGFLPQMLVKSTSDREYGQIYMPLVNGLMFGVVCLLVLFFGSSERLAGAYGLAVSGTIAIDTILFVAVMRLVNKKPAWYAVVFVLIFSTLDAVFVATGIPKLASGAWLPLGVSVLLFVLIKTWAKGQHIASGERKVAEGSLHTFVKNIHDGEYNVKRIPGQAVFIGHHERLAPLAMHAAVEEMHALHKKAVVVSVTTTNHAHIPEEDRATIDDLGEQSDGISHLKLRYGFHDHINIPRALESARHLSPELDFDPEEVSYFVSISRVVPTHRHNMAGWRKRLYSFLYRNAMSSSEYYKLPIERTTEIRSLIRL